MKIPEKAPSWLETLKNTNRSIQNFLSLRETIKKSNQEYLYWDQFKYLKFPEGIKPEEAWAALKLARLGQAKHITLTDKNKLLFSYSLPDQALKNLHFIDQNASGQILVEEPGVTKVEKPKYIIRSIMEEAITSSQIEGAATTRVVAKEMLRTGRKPENYAEKMIYNNYITITKIKEITDRPLTPELIKKIHGYITAGTLDDPFQEGNFRTEDVEVFDIDGQKVLHSPPSHVDIEKSIELLCKFANEDEEDFVHPIMKGIILHFWLAYLHPFMDGNGRTGRALFYWYVLKKKYWLFEYLSISSIILKKRIQYYKSFLYSEMDDGDMTYFLMFHLCVIIEAIRELREYLERKQRESNLARRFLLKYPGLNYRQRFLLANAVERPDEVYTFEKHANIHDIVYETARTDLFELHKLGLLDMRKEGRKYYFNPAQGLKDRLMGK